MSSEIEDEELQMLRIELNLMQASIRSLEHRKLLILERIKERRRAHYEATKQLEPTA